MRGMDSKDFTTLLAFRADVYAACERRRDSLFECTGALLTAGSVSSLPHLSLQPAHRRGWGSLYDALATGCLDTAALRRLLAAHPLADGAATAVFMPTQILPERLRRAARVATVPSSPVATRLPGRHPTMRATSTTPSTARYTCVHGRICTPSRKTTASKGRAAPSRWCAVF